MLFLRLLVALGLIQSAFSQGWHSGYNANTIFGVSAGATATETYAAGFSSSGAGGFLYYSGDRSNNQPSSVIPVGGANAINMDVAVSNDNNNICVVGSGGIFVGNAGTGSPVIDQVTGTGSGSIWTQVVSQQVKPYGASGFAAVGRFTATSGQNLVTTNGVAYASSVTGPWVVSDIGLSTTDGYLARYGSFPSTTTWYVTSGNWQHETDAKLEDTSVVRVSGRLSITFDEANSGVPLISYMSARHLQGTFPGAISKTTNGGQTWTKVFDSNGKFYMNQIDCFDVNNCFAVGEDMKSAVILKTTNGGANWATVMTLKGPKSLHSVKMISDTEVWVAGGEPSVGQYQYKDWVGTYFHSIDGGATWANTEFNGYGYDLAFKGGVGYSSAFFKQHTDIWIYQ